MSRKIWEQWEEEYVQAAWGEVSLRRIADRLGRTELAIKKRGAQMGLSRRKAAASTWTEADNEILTKYWGNEPPSKVARRLGRSVQAVKYRAQKLFAPPPPEADKCRTCGDELPQRRRVRLDGEWFCAPCHEDYMAQYREY
jgi:formylmethanofuran dehydrogenase subunit E